MSEKEMKDELEKESEKQEEVQEEADEKGETDLLKEKIAELEASNLKLKNDYLKAYADTENMKKRLQSEFELSKKYRIQSFALDILPVLDNLERALAAPSDEENSYRKGVEMIYAQLVHALNKEGVEEVEAEGKEFDANFHQAIMTEAVEGVESNQVLEVFQKGYKLKDRLLRAAMVKVSE